MEKNVLTAEEKKQNRDERRRRRKYRLLILLLLMFGTGIMLATSTYAWFTANKTVSIGSLDVNIEAKNGIQISADGTNWKSIVQKTDLSAAINTYGAAVNQLPDVLEPVSTDGTVSEAGKLPMFYGQVLTSTSDTNNGSYILTATPSAEANGSTGQFISFDLFFKVDKDTNIYLTPNSKVTTSDETDTGIKNASRIAFVVLGSTTAGDTVANIQALNSGATSPIYIWEPNYNTHTAAGLANARDVYGTTAYNSATAGSLVAYSGISGAIDVDQDVLLGKATATDYSTLFKDVNISYSTTATNTDYIQIFSLANGITKVRVYMWVEGQDVDCENNASGGNITFDLQITTENPNEAVGG